ncbi:nuclear transport factor 2 family protein [Nocardia alni]|uniref:nuclear transport factor 2 family protein n=1 Tax=Nocardia alni TaxID=2815723 RepID=UPI001C238C2A|nr:nuclear transport factor 2 family protein [Nocardia alni]
MLDNTDRLLAIEAIRRAKARYFRGVDTCDGEMVRDILAADCVLDYRGCCTDPATGHDFLPAMNVVMRGRESWVSDGLSGLGIVSVHQSHDSEITLTGDRSAGAIWSMTDRLYMPAGSDIGVMTGFGYYHETYEQTGGAWQIKTLRITRLRVEGA